jgi:hypothetical protein
LALRTPTTTLPRPASSPLAEHKALREHVLGLNRANRTNEDGNGQVIDLVKGKDYWVVRVFSWAFNLFCLWVSIYGMIIAAILGMLAIAGLIGFSRDILYGP